MLRHCGDREWVLLPLGPSENIGNDIRGEKRGKFLSVKEFGRGRSLSGGSRRVGCRPADARRSPGGLAGGQRRFPRLVTAAGQCRLSRRACAEFGRARLLPSLEPAKNTEFWRGAGSAGASPSQILHKLGAKA